MRILYDKPFRPRYTKDYDRAFGRSHRYFPPRGSLVQAELCAVLNMDTAPIKLMAKDMLISHNATII